jgi:hypothetical protein
MFDLWRYLRRMPYDERPARRHSAHGPWLGIVLTALAVLLVLASILGRTTRRPRPNSGGRGAGSGCNTGQVCLLPASAPARVPAANVHYREFLARTIQTEPARNSLPPVQAAAELAAHAPPSAAAPGGNVILAAGDDNAAGKESAAVNRTSPAAPRVGVLLDALRWAESAGDNRALGDGGRARGPFQIHRQHWERAVRGTDAAGWSYDVHVWDRDRAAYVTYLSWCKVCPEALTAWNPEHLARCHRLPFAPWRADNAKYWAKVQGAMR